MRSGSGQPKIASVNICAISAIVIGHTMMKSSRSRMVTPSRHKHPHPGANAIWIGSAEDREREYLRDQRDRYRPHNDELVQKPHGYALTPQTPASWCECDTAQRLRW